MASRYQLVADDLVRAQASARSRRRTLSIVTMIYLAVTALSCMMLVCVNVAPADFGAWHFWRFFLTPLCILVGALFLYVAATSCECASAPTLVPIVVGIVHFIWTMVVVGFTINDLVNCTTTTWCTVPPATSIDIYFVMWLVGIFAGALLEAIMCITGAMLYAVQRRLCLSPCARRIARAVINAGGGGGMLRSTTTTVGGGGVIDPNATEEGDAFDGADASEAARVPLIGLPMPVSFATPPARGASKGATGAGSSAASSPTSSALLGAQLSDAAVAALRAHDRRQGDLAALTKQH